MVAGYKAIEICTVGHPDEKIVDNCTNK
jgi:hypothetical protein